MPVPTTTAVAPAAGPVAGGTAVTLTGTNYTGTTGVTFGGTAATSVVVVSNTSITCVAPAHAAGVVDVIVTNASGAASASSTDKFTYDAAPTVTSVVEAAGPTAGGTAVTITGTGFADETSVLFGATPATGVVVVSDTSITCVSPPHAAGTVNVSVSNETGASAAVAASRFTFNDPIVTEPYRGATAVKFSALTGA